MPTQEQKTKLVQLKISSHGPYVSVMQNVATPPAAVSNLLNMPSGDHLRQELTRLSDALSDANLNAESGLAKDKGYYKLSNWASGGQPFRRFRDDALTDYFEELFQTVVAVSLSHQGGNAPWFVGNPIQLNRSDLFHGHLIFDTSAPFADVLMLFHAKEYPSDIEPNKSGHAKHLEPNAHKDFLTSSPDFKYRCSVFSLRLNKLWMLRLSDNGSPFRILVNDRNLNAYQNPLRIDQADLGDCVSDVNFFPNDGVRLFFCVMPKA